MLLNLWHWLTTRLNSIVTECENGQAVEEKNIMSVPKVNKVKTGIETFSFIGPKIWNSLSEELKNTKSLVSFKSKSEDSKFTGLLNLPNLNC